jgi:hypothetical protein
VGCSVWRLCRRWSSNNGFSMLLSEPDDRVWFVIRDRCMFDLLYQRLCRDELYRRVLTTVIDMGYLPVYHVRTADSNTYWGAIMDRTKLTLTGQASVPVDLAQLSMEKSSVFTDDPRTLLIGKNRLGALMVATVEQYRRVYVHGQSLRARVVPLLEKVPDTPLTPLYPLDFEAINKLPCGEPLDTGLPPAKRPKTAKAPAATSSTVVAAVSESPVSSAPASAAVTPVPHTSAETSGHAQVAGVQWLHAQGYMPDGDDNLGGLLQELLEEYSDNDA